MKILVIGSGGREHAICHTFHKQGHDVIAIPQNGGTASFAPNRPVNPSNFDEVVNLVRSEKIDLTVVGPENFLAEGIQDYFSKEGLKLFGPKKEATKLESSKSWAKQFMKTFGIPTADFVVCSSKDQALDVINQKFDVWGGAAIKPSGLTAGKGVICCSTIHDAHEAIRIHFEEKRYGAASNEVVVEELLEGPECSLLAFCDGSTICPMIPSQDHKRLWENDAGPNTGGVGAYSPVPFIGEQILHEIDEKIVQPTLGGLKQSGIQYQGIIYFGLMLTSKGPRLLEYNCRFGDPEAQVVLPLLQNDLAELMLDCCDGMLSKHTLLWKPGAACVVVMCSGGYPHSYQTGYPITGLDELGDDESIIVYHAGTKLDDAGQLVTNGGRVLGVTGLAGTLNEAVSHAYRGVATISFTDSHYRRDIANQAVRDYVS